MADDLEARLVELQADRDELTEQIREIQERLHIMALHEAIERHLDSLPPDDRGVLIEAAAARLGSEPGKV